MPPNPERYKVEKEVTHSIGRTYVEWLITDSQDNLIVTTYDEKIAERVAEMLNREKK